MGENIQELRDYLATEVMGWYRVCVSTDPPSTITPWLDASGSVMMPVSCFTPDTDANQALMLLEKTGCWARLFYEQVLSSEPRRWACALSQRLVRGYGDADTLPLAICRAVKAWKEAQE